MQADKTLNIGRDRLFNLLGEYRLLVPVKRAYHKTTNSHHRFYRHPNLLKPGPEQVTALEPEQVWVADITYLPQYCSVLYQSVHERNGITCSMTDGYDCYQNALAERINGILKNEFLLSRPADLEQAREIVKESVAIYNHERPHLALKYKTPDDVHQAFYRQKTVNLYQD